MVEEVRELVEVKETRSKVVAEVRRCDICGKVIFDSRNKLNYELMKGSFHWWRLMTCHSDWGKDSLDSVERFDVCSPECLETKFKEYLAESGSRINTMEFNVRHMGA